MAFGTILSNRSTIVTEDCRATQLASIANAVTRRP